MDKTQKVAGLALNGDISKDDLVESIIGKINPPQINPASSTGYPAQYGKTADGTPVFCSGMNVWEELAKLEDVPYSINDLSDGTIAVRKFNADTDGDAPPNSAPPSNAVTAHYPVPCLWYHGGDVWFVYAISTSTVGGVPYYTYTSVQLTNEQDISGKENTSNKVTVLSAQSTNAQYPSAKCVYDAVSSVDPPLLVQIEYDENLGQYASDKTTQEIAAKFPNVTFVLETVTCLTGYCEPSNHIYTIYVLGLFNGYDPMVSAYSGRRNGSTDKLVFTQTGRVFNSAYAEKWSNRVSVLNAQSTEYTYPNAKCVYDALALKANTSAIPKRTSQLANDSGFLTAHQDISGKMDLAPEVSSTGGQLAQPPGQLYRGTGNDVYLKTGAQGSSTDNIRLVAYDDLKVFMVNLTMNTYHGRPSSYNDAYYNADKTIDEIKAAVLAGKEVIFRADYVTYVNSYQDYILDHTYLYFTLSRTIIPEPGAYGFDPSTICAYCITFGTVEENFAYSVLHLHWIGNEWRASKVSEQA